MVFFFISDVYRKYAVSFYIFHESNRKNCIKVKRGAQKEEMKSGEKKINTLIHNVTQIRSTVNNLRDTQSQQSKIFSIQIGQDFFG